MTIYRCRTVKPYTSDWFNQESETPEQAANDFHESKDSLTSLKLYVYPKPDERYEIHFALVEVEGHGEWVSRVFHYGIGRRGGVKRRGTLTFDQKLAKIAEALGWTHDPKDLMNDDAFEYVEPEPA